MSKINKEIPIFKTEDEEREFWSNHDSTEYVDWKQAKVGLFPNLKPSLDNNQLNDNLDRDKQEDWSDFDVTLLDGLEDN